jgi:hypothetical protein
VGVVSTPCDQQQNGYDCGPFTIANCLKIVHSWGQRRAIPLPPMSEFRLWPHWLPPKSRMLSGRARVNQF